MFEGAPARHSPGVPLGGRNGVPQPSWKRAPIDDAHFGVPS